MDYYLHLFVEDNDMEGFGVSVWRDTCRTVSLDWFAKLLARQNY